MKTIQQIAADMQACLDDMNSLQGKAQAATDEPARAEFLAAYNGKARQFEDLKKELEAAQTMAKNQEIINGAKAFITPVPANINAPAGITPAPGNAGGTVTPVPDAAKDAQAKSAFFLDYCRFGAKSLSGQAFNAIAPQDSRYKSLAEDAVLVPASLINGILGQDERFGGKTMLITDATAGTNSNIAATVAPDFRAQLLRQPVNMPSLYDLCRLLIGVNGKATWPMLDQTVTGGNFGGIAFTWKTTDGADKGETEPKFRDWEVTTHELSGWTEISIAALSRPAIQVEAELTQLFRDAARYEFSRVIMNGTGSNQPLGILAASSGITVVPRSELLKIKWVDITNLEYGVSMLNRQNARFIVTDPAEKFCKQSLDSTGRPLFTADVATGPRSNMAGYPYLTHEYGINLGAKGDLIFGNFQNYGFAVESDIAIARSEHAAFKSGKIVFRMMCYVGGKPIYANAFAALKAEIA